MNGMFHEEDWPHEAEEMYERIEVLGRGSFGLVWMGKRMTPPIDELDDEYVALKNIEIKEEKGKVYAEREISILSELRHPYVIRLIRAFPIYNNTSRLVALQLARGPNLQRVVSKRGALGLPLARLVSRQLISAVSYLHGRAVLHRDIKPTNCILENTELPPTEYYDYSADYSIWSDDEDAEEQCARSKWRVMLVDFGFARALEEKEYKQQKAPMRGSVLLEKLNMAKLIGGNRLESGSPNNARQDGAAQKVDGDSGEAAAIVVDDDDSDNDVMDDMALVEQAAAAMRRVSIQEENMPFAAINEKVKQRASHVSVLEGVDEDKPTVLKGHGAEEENGNGVNGGRPTRSKRNAASRQSTTRTKMRSMSALGTKAYAAPEIKHKLRNKTTEDFEKRNAALTECVADYGMIVDAYSVGWTLRVALTGVPPNSTISQYMKKYAQKEAEEEIVEVGCCCFGGGSAEPEKKVPKVPAFRVRDTDDLPKEATLFISALTKPNPEERMTVREAQNHAWIRGSEGETPYEIPQGDYDSHHGAPVVPLRCAPALSKIVEDHHH